MPRPFQAPWGRVWGMGIRLCAPKILKRCRSLSAVVIVVSVWTCLITVINLGSNGQQVIPALKEDPHFPIRSDGLSNYLPLFGFSPTDKRSSSSSIATLEKTLFQQNELRKSIPSLQSGMKTVEGDGQTLNLTKNEIIRGRRIQEIKFSQTGALETLSRKHSEDHGDSFPINGKRNSFIISEEGRQIDTVAITKMEIKLDIPTPTKKLGNVLPNWTQQFDARAFHFSSARISKHEWSKLLEKSEPSSIASSRVKNVQSNPDTSDRKTPSEYSQMSSVMAKYRLHDQEKSMREYFPQNIGKMRNRQNNFYASSRDRINTHFNETKWNGEREKELRAIPSNSRSLFMENGYNSLNDSSTNVYNVTIVQSLGEVRLKSNLQSLAGTQMNVPEHNKDISQQNSIDQSKQSLPTKMNRDVEYPEDVAEFQHEFDKIKVELNVPGSAYSITGVNQTGTKKYDRSKPTMNVKKIVVNGAKSGPETTIGLLAEQSQFSSVGRLELQNAGETLGASGGHTDSDMAEKTALKVRSEHVDMKYDGFELYAYNVTASDALSLNRDIPDTRPDGCERLPPSSSAGLPKATVIICFHNEALSVLARTVTSVLSRSPGHLLEKIMLVDDYSTLDNMTAKLEEQLGHLEKVFFTRTAKREGLVGARLLGASLATSEVIVFLDAHCECNVGWLEPLLSSLSQNPRKVVSPYIDTIKSENFQYKRSPAHLQGGFSWRMEFGWRAATGRGGLLQEAQPILTPVISGGLFAVQRKYFTSMGGYDPQFNIWGGENFELSFKTWMCGGSVEIVPCSRVGHVFRASLPYAFTGDRRETVLRNLARVASVWMDDYADLFYAAVDFPNELDIGDTSERAQLRKSLNCQSFKWYLDNVFPQMEVVTPDTVVYGQVRNKGSLMCFDVMSSAFGYHLGLSPCHGGRNQTLHLTFDNKLKQGEACIVPGINKQLMLSKCTSDVLWVYQKDHLILNHKNLCVTSVDNTLVQLLPCEEQHTTTLYISRCTKSDSSVTESKLFRGSNSLSSHGFQEWTFDYSFNWKRRRRRGD